MNLTMVTDLCSIGTLFAFVLVCTGVLVLQNRPDVQRGKFRIPYVNSKYIVPPFFVILIVLAFTRFQTEATDFIFNRIQVYEPVTFVTSLTDEELMNVQKQISDSHERYQVSKKTSDAEAFLSYLSLSEYQDFIGRAAVSPDKKYERGWSLFSHKIPMWIFFILCVVICYYCVVKNLSLIPVLGLLSCLYMMCELGISNWVGFGIWLLIGLVIYFLYGYKHSKLNKDH